MYAYNNQRLNLTDGATVTQFRQTVQRAARNKEEFFAFQGLELHTEYGQYLLGFLRR